MPTGVCGDPLSALLDHKFMFPWLTSRSAIRFDQYQCWKRGAVAANIAGEQRQPVDAAWAPMKKSGSTPVRDPPELRNYENTFPARNRAARGIGAISRPASSRNTSRSSMRSNRRRKSTLAVIPSGNLVLPRWEHDPYSHSQGTGDHPKPVRDLLGIVPGTQRPTRDEWPKVNGGPGVNGFPPTSCPSHSHLQLRLKTLSGAANGRWQDKNALPVDHRNRKNGYASALRMSRRPKSRRLN